MNEDEIKISVGKKIKSLRKKFKLTQFELREKVGINQSQITLIESGKSFPSLRTLKNFSNIFNCEIKDIFEIEQFKDANQLKTELTEMIATVNYETLQRLYLIVKGLLK